MGRILVGIDGSPGSEAALAWAAAHASATGSSVLAVHVFHPPMLATGLRVASVPNSVLQDAAETSKAETLRLAEEEWVAPLRDAGVDYLVEVKEGSPGRVLVEMAGAEGVEAVVVGRRGHGELTDLVLGSVGHHLVHHCHVPVVIVPSA